MTFLVYFGETAKVDFSEQVQLELAQLSGFERRDLEKLDNIADAIISRMATFHLPNFLPDLMRRLDGKHMSRTTCFLFFMFAIHFLVFNLPSNYQKTHCRFPFWLTHIGYEIKTFPVTAICPKNFESLRMHPKPPVHLITFPIVSHKVGMLFNTRPSIP